MNPEPSDTIPLSALSAGRDHARGEVIVTLDGDLQNDPADIPTRLELAKEYDLVKPTYTTRDGFRSPGGN